MILVADSGSTKTDWCFIKADKSVDQITTVGLNPNFIEEEKIFKVIEALPYQNNDISKIYFYGSGCGTKKNAQSLTDAFLYKYPSAVSEVHTDLVGAAKACLGNDKGIIAILGTGSNSGVYDGRQIIEANPSLGHFMGDYGGGVDIGKQILRDYFYKRMPEDLRKEIQMTRYELIEQLYHKRNSNTFIASQTGLIFKHAETAYVKTLVGNIFDRFVEEEIMNYPSAKDLTVNFVGSIAYLFKDILEDSLRKKGLAIGNVIQKPINLLKEYHYIHGFNQ